MFSISPVKENIEKEKHQNKPDYPGQKKNKQNEELIGYMMSKDNGNSGGNSGGDGNGNSGGNKGGNEKGNSNDNSISNKGTGKFLNNGKHLGWYKNGKYAELIEQGLIPELAEATYYAIDVADPYTEVLMTYDERIITSLHTPMAWNA